MRLSVIIPCRNGGGLLGPTLECVLNQTRPPEELIVVDDGSTDGSLELAKGYEGVSVATTAWEGAPAARNRGMELATGDAVMFLDADDLLGPTVLENLLAVLGRYPDAVACCPWFRLEEDDGCWHSAPPSCAPRRMGQDDLAAWLTGWYQPPCSVLWSRTAFERTGGWDVGLRVNQDGDVMMRGFVLGNRLRMTDAGAAYYRRTPAGSRSLSSIRATRAGVEARLQVLERLISMLRERGRLWRYRGPLGEAYAAVAGDCVDIHPDLHETCLRNAREVSGPEWLHRTRWIAARAARKAAHLRRHYRLATVASAVPADRVDPRPPDGPVQRGENRPKVSVVVPTYNRARLLRRAIDSALGQSHRDLELLIVDDASTDRTADMVASYRDSRIRYFRQPANAGVAAARNRGMREAKGSLIAFLDSDDMWLPQKLELQVDMFERGPPALGLVHCAVEILDAGGSGRVVVPREGGLLRDRLLLSNVLAGGSCAMIRRSVIAVVGFFDEQLPAIEDYDYWLRIARFFRVDYVPEVLVRYDDRTGPPVAGDTERRSRNFRANFAARQQFYERNRHEMEQAGVEHAFLLESAKRHIRWPHGDQSAGRGLAARALARRPLSPSLYLWFAYALMPRGTHPFALALSKSLRSLRSTAWQRGIQGPQGGRG
ncbi:MAG: glycosyltransferase family 2 protein [Acetobacterales bacterium]